MTLVSAKHQITEVGRFKGGKHLIGRHASLKGAPRGGIRDLHVMVFRHPAIFVLAFAIVIEPFVH